MNAKRSKKVMIVVRLKKRKKEGRKEERAKRQSLRKEKY